MNRALQVAMLLAIAAAGIGLSARATREALRERGGRGGREEHPLATPEGGDATPTPPPLPAAGVGGSHVDEPLAPPTRPAPEQTTIPTGGSTAEGNRHPPDRIDLSPAQHAELSSALENWSFPEDLLRLADDLLRAPRSEHSERLLASRYRIAAELGRRARAGTPPLPERIHVITLGNDRTLYASTCTRAGDEFAVRTLSGIRAVISADDVTGSAEWSRQRYLDATRSKARARLEALRSGSLAQVQEGLRLALQRRDDRNATLLFGAWLAGEGPARLAAAVGPDADEALVTALALQGEHAAPARTRRETAGGGELPHSVADLRRRLDRVAQGLSSLDGEGRKRVIRQLVSWEEWIESDTASLLPRERDELRRRVQVLRLDVLKSSGF